MRIEVDIPGNNIEEKLVKKNRHRVKEAEKFRVVVGPKPPAGIHKESRKIRDKRRNLAVRGVVHR